ncbi:MAG: hypothetical protein MJ130_08170 [Lachnospiraceae bacterium]|nr:hypothetical protein [Lachnospiraceae bacterium]
MLKKLQLQVGRRKFLIFLIVWLGIIACAFIVLMFKFKQWLTDYQAVYEASRPALVMDTYFDWYQNNDLDTIYDNLTEKPVINEYETEANAKLFMSEVLDPSKATYAPSNTYSEAVPEYYVLSGDYIVSTARLRKSDTQTMDYSFPVWELNYLDFYCEPQYDVYVYIPENVSATVNGLPLNENYCFSADTVPEDQAAFGSYATLPLMKKYKIDNFYQLPAIEAVNADNYTAEVSFNNSTGVYEVGYGDNPDAEEMKAVAIGAAKVFANYLANDVSQAAMQDCFVPGCEIIRFIIAGREDAGKFFKYHSSLEYTNIEVDRFICYDSNTFACDVHMDQEIYRYTEAPFEVDQVNYRFYYIKYNGVWKACYINILQTRE